MECAVIKDNMDKLEILCGEDLQFNNYITIHFPTLKEIKTVGEDLYLNTIYKFCSTPSDYKVLLDDKGINYAELDDYEFFLMIYSSFGEPEKEGLQLVLRDFDITQFEISTRDDGSVILALDDKIFDKAVYVRLVDILRQMNNFVRRADIPGNEHTRLYEIEKERRRMKYRRNKKEESRLFPLIVALVNTPEFKYDYTTVWSLNIFQFYQSVRQIQKNQNYNHIMQGIYAGTLDSKKINMDNIHWLSSKA